MLENKESLEKCDACFSQLAYVLGYCPVCNDTGFVKKQAKEPLLLEYKDYDSSAVNSLMQGVQCEWGLHGCQV